MNNTIAKIKEITKPIADLLGKNLVGIYLHGSLAMGSGTPGSDIDLLIIIRQAESFALYRRIIDYAMTLNNLPKKGIEFSVILLEHCRNFTHPTPFELHYGQSHSGRYRSDPSYICGGTTDQDLAAHFKVTRERGICLHGDPIVDVFPDIPHVLYWASVTWDLVDAETGVHKEPVYHILNYCRSLCYLRTGRIASKAEGGEWALQHIAADYHSLVRKALEQYRQGIQTDDWDIDQLYAFINYVKGLFWGLF